MQGACLARRPPGRTCCATLYMDTLGAAIVYLTTFSALCIFIFLIGLSLLLWVSISCMSYSSTLVRSSVRYTFHRSWPSSRRTWGAIPSPLSLTASVTGTGLMLSGKFLSLAHAGKGQEKNKNFLFFLQNTFLFCFYIHTHTYLRDAFCLFSLRK